MEDREEKKGSPAKTVAKPPSMMHKMGGLKKGGLSIGQKSAAPIGGGFKSKMISS